MRQADTAPVIVWFRRDLRLCDNPALHHAAGLGAPIVPVFILDEASPGPRKPGAAQKWMLHQGLAGLADGLARLGASLVVRKGAAAAVLDELINETGARAVLWNRRLVPEEIRIDCAIEAGLHEKGIETKSFRADLLHDPSSLLSGSGGFFKVFTPFWRTFRRTIMPRQPLGAPKRLAGFAETTESLPLNALGLLPTRPDWAGGLRETWVAGEDGARQHLDAFLGDGLRGYAGGRDLPAGRHVSRLSPYLRWGMISPFQLWHAAEAASADERDKEKFLQEVAWREFWYHLLAHFPDLAWRNFHQQFNAFPWREDSPHLDAWKKGETGYPIVDAGMRQLWRTGYMHNRVRMIAASFLVKHLMVDWRVGEAWFWDTLVDGDPASNPASWQWVAGSGADGQPFFRIFNPVLQATKFDPQGDYVRQWVPEIAALPERCVHAPWAAPDRVLAACEFQPGETYPTPVVDHGKARQRALAAFRETVRGH